MAEEATRKPTVRAIILIGACIGRLLKLAKLIFGKDDRSYSASCPCVPKIDRFNGPIRKANACFQGARASASLRASNEPSFFRIDCATLRPALIGSPYVAMKSR